MTPQGISATIHNVGKPGDGWWKAAARGGAGGRLGLRDAGVVRAVRPTAADLTKRQREGASPGSDLDAYAVRLARHKLGSFSERRAGESDAAYARRRRHFDALNLARRLVLELEDLRPVAEGWKATEENERDLGDAIAACEAARQAEGEATTSRYVETIVAQLERYRQVASAVRTAPPFPWETPPEWADHLWGNAVRAAPELRVLTREDWRKASAGWKGRERPPRGRPRKGAPRYDWAAIVLAMLLPHGLTEAKDATQLAETCERAKRKR